MLRSVLSTYLFLLSGAFAYPVLAQGSGTQAELVADLSSVSATTLVDSNLGYASAVLDGVAYFPYNDGIHGRELWRSDGTTSGTRMITDLCPGICGANGRVVIESVAVFDDAIFFTGSDGVHGTELWRTDGTPAGTAMVRDLAPGLIGSNPAAMVPTSTHLFFSTDIELGKAELWVTDGTTLGTRRVALIDEPGDGSPTQTAIALGDILVFEVGRHLWRSDGTAGGTFEISDLLVTTRSWVKGAPFQRLGNRLLFTGSPANGSPSLWASDGTTVWQVMAGQSSLGPEQFVVAGDKMYFQDGQGLFETDGTSNGTNPISLPPGVTPFSARGWRTSIGEALVFVGWSSETGREPYLAANAVASLIKDVRPGPDSSFPIPSTNNHGPFFSFESEAIFFADDGTHGMEPWHTDGTSAGTTMLLDLTVGQGSSYFPRSYSDWEPAEIAGSVLFPMHSGSGGTVLWRTDGTPGGTQSVAPLNRQASSIPVPVSESPFGPPAIEDCFDPVEDGLFFLASDGESGVEPHFVGADSDAIERVADLGPGHGDATNLRCRFLSGRAIFSYTDFLTEFPRERLASWNPTTREVESLTETEAPIVFSTIHDDQLWISSWDLLRTDGTPGGTEVLEPMLPSSDLAWLGDQLLFGRSGAIWSSAGTPGSAVEVVPRAVGPFSIFRPVAVGSGLVFWGRNQGDSEPWFTDGTANGSGRLKDIRPGPEPSIHGTANNPIGLPAVTLGNRALFPADDGLHGTELWATQGTPGSTALLIDLMPGPYPSNPRDLTRYGGRVYFSAEGEGTGRELWSTDGTAAGTRLEEDLFGGPNSSAPAALTASPNGLLFSAYTPATGREAWLLRASQGSAVTELLADIAPGPLSSSPLGFQTVGNVLFLPANDNVHGFELWRIQDFGLIYQDGFETGTTGLWTSSTGSR